MLCTLCFFVFPVSVCILLYVLWSRKYRYWENHNVPCVPASFPFGNFYSAFMMREPLFEVVGKVYDDFENVDLVGMYAPTEPCLLLRSAELAKQVLIDNFNDFVDNGFEATKSVDPGIGYNPFSQKGQQWKEARSIHTPVFTTSKLKMMMNDIICSAKSLMDYIDTERKNVLSMGSVTKMYLIDAVSKCAYGVESNVWKTPQPLLQYLISNGITTSEFEVNVSALCSILLPWANYIARAKVISGEAMRYMKEIYKTVVLQRRDNRQAVRKDLVQHLLETDEKLKAEGKQSFTDTTWATNLLVFFLDGTETASVAMMYTLYCIAKHKDVQRKLREEMREAGINLDHLEYDKVHSLEYMDMVLTECLRLYPPVPLLSRKSTKDTTLGGVRVPRGMKILVPALKLHTDSRNVSNPNEFDPERFSAERKNSIPKGAYLSFGEGPRLCVGMKFARTSIKVGLVAMLLNYELSLGPSHKGNLKVHKGSTFFLFPENGLVEVKFSPISGSDLM